VGNSHSSRASRGISTGMGMNKSFMRLGMIFWECEGMGMSLFSKILDFAVDAEFRKATRKLVYRITGQLAVSA